MPWCAAASCSLEGWAVDSKNPFFAFAGARQNIFNSSNTLISNS
jgi:hypothetical protein